MEEEELGGGGGERGGEGAGVAEGGAEEEGEKEHMSRSGCRWRDGEETEEEKGRNGNMKDRTDENGKEFFILEKNNMK